MVTLTGYGSGDASGDGSGDDRQAYSDALLAVVLAPPGARITWWRSDGAGRPANGGRGATVAHVGLIEEVAGPLAVCTEHALHGSLSPWDYRGERLWIVALYGEVQERGGKMGALKREILAEVTPNPWA